MIKLKITKKSNYLYSLMDEENNNYIINLELLDIEDEIKEGDYITISEELLNPKYDGYSSFYTFGNLNSKYGKSESNLDTIEIIKIEKENKEILLKRLYG